MQEVTIVVQSLVFSFPTTTLMLGGALSSSRPFDQSVPQANAQYSQSGLMLTAVVQQSELVLVLLAMVFVLVFFSMLKARHSKVPHIMANQYLFSLTPMSIQLTWPTMSFLQLCFFCCRETRGLAIRTPLWDQVKVVLTTRPSWVPNIILDLGDSRAELWNFISPCVQSKMYWYSSLKLMLLSLYMFNRAHRPSWAPTSTYGKLKATVFVLAGNLYSPIWKLLFWACRLKTFKTQSMPNDIKTWCFSTQTTLHIMAQCLPITPVLLVFFRSTQRTQPLVNPANANLSRVIASETIGCPTQCQNLLSSLF